MVFDPVSAIAAGGTLLGGAGSLFGALRGGGRDPAGDYASLAAQLAPGNVGLTVAAQQLGALTAPYVQGLNTNTALQASAQLGILNDAINKSDLQSQLLAGVAGAYQAAVIGNETERNRIKNTIEFLGPATAANLTNLFGQSAAATQAQVLKGESDAMNTITAGQVQQGLNAANLRNQTVARLADTNMDIRKQQEQTKNQLALQRGQIEGQLALQRAGASRALAGAQMFA